VDNEGWRICKEGPYSENEVRLITEFGEYRRDASE
jgi:hypothetical protein